MKTLNSFSNVINIDLNSDSIEYFRKRENRSITSDLYGVMKLKDVLESFLAEYEDEFSYKFDIYKNDTLVLTLYDGEEHCKSKFILNNCLLNVVYLKTFGDMELCECFVDLLLVLRHKISINLLMFECAVDDLLVNVLESRDFKKVNYSSEGYTDYIKLL